MNVTRDQIAQAREIGTDPASGKPVSVRMGRFGPFVPIGTKDDEEKPRFAGLRPGQKTDSITLDEGLELFKLPRTLGSTPEGETIVANVGRFGPYLKYGSKYVSLKDDDPYTISLERALELIRLTKEADANRIIQELPYAGVQVPNGRYGPYVTDKKNARVPKDRDPKSLSLEEGRVFGASRRCAQARCAVRARAIAYPPAGASPALPPGPKSQHTLRAGHRRSRERSSRRNPAGCARP